MTFSVIKLGVLLDSLVHDFTPRDFYLWRILERQGLPELSAHRKKIETLGSIYLYTFTFGYGEFMLLKYALPEN